MSPWLDALILSAATAATLLAVARQAPWQNVVAAALLAGLPGTALPTLASGASTGVSLIAMHLVSVVLVLNARGVARLALEPFPTVERRGWWVLGLMGIQVGILAVACAQLFSRGANAWLPAVGPWLAFVVGCASSVLAAVLATPFLLNKRPGPMPVPSRSPLVLLTGLSFYCAAASGSQQSWTGRVAGAALGVAVIAVFARANRAPRR